MIKTRTEVSVDKTVGSRMRMLKMIIDSLTGIHHQEAVKKKRVPEVSSQLMRRKSNHVDQSLEILTVMLEITIESHANV